MYEVNRNTDNRCDLVEAVLGVQHHRGGMDRPQTCVAPTSGLQLTDSDSQESRVSYFPMSHDETYHPRTNKECHRVSGTV